MNMKYRKFSEQGKVISVLGLGVMQISEILQNRDGKFGGHSKKLIRHIIDSGVNYLDLGFPYFMKDPKNSAEEVSAALKDGYRSRVTVSANLPASKINSAADFDKYLLEQMKLFDLEKINICFIDEINRETWKKVLELGFIEWAENSINNKLIAGVGLSFHDDTFYLNDILTCYDGWSAIQLKYSYMDYKHHPGVTGIKAAAQKGIPVVITEPLKSGRLVRNVPESVKKIWEGTADKESLKERGLRWLWNYHEVSTIVCDMPMREQADEYLSLADKAEAGVMDVYELVQTDQMRDQYYKKRKITCSACRCCLPCPKNIDVPRIIELYQDSLMYNVIDVSRYLYKTEGHTASECVECGRCIEKCPRTYGIVEILKDAQTLFEF